LDDLTKEIKNYRYAKYYA